jgi:hypothetical protein
MFRIEFENSLISSGGELFVQYRPVVKIKCIGEGSMSFAAWDVPVGAPVVEHESAKQAARDNVLAVLRRMVAEL